MANCCMTVWRSGDLVEFDLPMSVPVCDWWHRSVHSVVVVVVAAAVFVACLECRIAWRWCLIVMANCCMAVWWIGDLVDLILQWVFAEVFLDSLMIVSLFSHATIRPEINQFLVYLWRTVASGLPPPRFSPHALLRWMWSFSVGLDDQRCRLNWRKLIVIPSDLSPRASPPTLCWSWMWPSSVGFDDQRFQSYLNCCVFSLHFEPAVLVFFLPFWHC